MESEKLDKYLDLARELKLGDIKVTVILVVTGSLGTVSKILEKRLGKLGMKGRIKAIQTTKLLKSTRMLTRVIET